MNLKFYPLPKRIAFGLLTIGSLITFDVGVGALGAIASEVSTPQGEMTEIESPDDYKPAEALTPAETTTEEAITEETTSEETITEEATTEATGTLLDVAAGNESFTTLIAAVEAADLVDELSSEQSYTIFAPTDEAFEALPEGMLEELMLPENKSLLVQFLAYHIVPNEVMSADATSGEVSTVAGAPLALTIDEATGAIMVNEATVVTPDITASNGVIHGIDQVLLPPNLALK